MRSWKFNHIDFSTYPFYSGNDLGVFWAPEKTKIKVWAPTAQMVEFRLYKDGESGEAFYKTNLIKGEQGTWSTVLNGDYEGKFYTIRVNDGDWLDEVPDMYARCVGINGKRGMIYNSNKTNPEGWVFDQGPKLQKFSDAIVYETHVRDFSIASNSGIRNKGKFLGFTEEGTVLSGVKTGLDHLVELGVTHVHLLPVNDFATVDEAQPDESYNWGYDPLHYWALEGSYSTNSRDGRTRIVEFKQLVKALHDQSIGVILDVVFNHTYFTKQSVFNQIVPGYFYRQKPDGSFANASGCGNEIASERAMVRKYLIDTLTYWVEEYHIDGFRFDLMGILDMKTMQEIRIAMNRLDPGILLYGEGWAADESPMPEDLRAVKRNTVFIPGVASFNDDFRDALRGRHGEKRSKGFVSGQALREEAVKFGIVAAVQHPQINYGFVETVSGPWAQEPVQCVNYVSCHDNYTLWDKLKLSLPKADEAELKRRVKLAAALLLTSQGIPFLHSGMEFCRTKGGVENSYKSPDSVNQLDWERKQIFYDVFDYIRKLISIRKKHPAFCCDKADTVREVVDFCTQYKIGVVAYCIHGEKAGDEWKRILLFFNGNEHEEEMPLPEGQYSVVALGQEVDEKGLMKVSERLIVEPVSMSMLVQV